MGQQKSAQRGIGTGVAARKLATYVQVKKAILHFLQYLVLVCLNSDWFPTGYSLWLFLIIVKGEA